MSNDARRSDAGEHDLVITRTFNAPRQLVWQAWTQPEHIAAWFGPRGFTTRVDEYDFRPGGIARYVMVGPDGTEYPAVGVFKEISPQHRIVTTDEFDDGFEKIMNLSKLPQGVVTTVTFDEDGERTHLTLRISHPTAEDLRKHEEMGVVGGWNSSLDCLDEHLTAMAA